MAKKNAKRKGGARKGAGRPMGLTRTRATISVPSDLLHKARQLGLPISGSCVEGLRLAVSKAESER